MTVKVNVTEWSVLDFTIISTLEETDWHASIFNIWKYQKELEEASALSKTRSNVLLVTSNSVDTPRGKWAFFRIFHKAFLMGSHNKILHALGLGIQRRINSIVFFCLRIFIQVMITIYWIACMYWKYIEIPLCVWTLYSRVTWSHNRLQKWLHL